MKIGKTKLSKRTIALLAVTVLLFGGGSFTATRAALTYFSEDYRAAFELDHLQVHLIENGTDVCHGENDIYTVHRTDDETAQARAEKYKGNLVEYLGYSNDTHKGDTPSYQLGEPGKVDPGRKYKEEISAKNGNNIDEYVRLTVRKYWVDADGNKDTSMDPALIRLTYGDNEYNSSAWAANKQESTPESETYYLRNVLKANASSPLLFDTLQIDKSVYDLGDKKTTTTTRKEGEENVTVITYEYDYDGFTFYIEADVQAIQTHNVNDAIESLWGVKNVTAGNGRVTVN